MMAADAFDPRANQGSAAPSALYRQVKNYVMQRIAEGAWIPGARVPSEQELLTQFGVSRMTVNRALRELANEGRLIRVAGVGTFVAQPKPQSTLLRVADMAEEIRARGHAYRCDVIAHERVAAPLEVAAALGLPAGEMVFHSVCVHHENGVPLQLEDRYVNPNVAPGYLGADFSDTTPTHYLIRHVPYDEIEHVVDALLPSAEQARLLEMPRTQPCLVLTRRTWSAGHAVTFVRCLHPSDRYQLGSRIHHTHQLSQVS